MGPAGLLQNCKFNSLEENETGEIIDVSPCLSQPIVSPNPSPIVKKDDVVARTLKVILELINRRGRSNCRNENRQRTALPQRRAVISLFSGRTTPAARDRIVHILDTDNGWHPAAKVGCELTGAFRTPVEAFNTLSGVSTPGNAV